MLFTAIKTFRFLGEPPKLRTTNCTHKYLCPIYLQLIAKTISQYGGIYVNKFYPFFI